MKRSTQTIGFALLILLGYLGYQHPLFFDVTYNKTNSLNAANLEFLTKIDKPLNIQLYSQDDNIKEKVKSLVSLFQRETPFIHLRQESKPLLLKEKATLGLHGEHHLLLTYDNQIKAIDLNIANFDQQALSNLLFQSIRNASEWIVFLSGHGEAEPLGTDNTDLNKLSLELKNKGLKLSSLNLNDIGIIPDNTETLVINAIKSPLLPHETQKILAYLEKGGNLLWLAPPETPIDQELSKSLGIEWENGSIEDFQATKLGAANPEINVITSYPKHAITEQQKLLSVFPHSRAFTTEKAQSLGWEVSPFLMTHADTTLKVKETIIKGPFTLGVTLSKGKQRIVVIGNSHFLSNAGIHNYGNMQLANNIFNWLNVADLPLNISYDPPIDSFLTQTVFTKMTFQYFFPFFLPFTYFLIGWHIHRKRYKRRC